MLIKCDLIKLNHI